MLRAPADREQREGPLVGEQVGGIGVLRGRYVLAGPGAPSPSHAARAKAPDGLEFGVLEVVQELVPQPVERSALGETVQRPAVPGPAAGPVGASAPAAAGCPGRSLGRPVGAFERLTVAGVDHFVEGILMAEAPRLLDALGGELGDASVRSVSGARCLGQPRAALDRLRTNPASSCEPASPSRYPRLGTVHSDRTLPVGRPAGGRSGCCVPQWSGIVPRTPELRLLPRPANGRLENLGLTCGNRFAPRQESNLRHQL